MTLPWRARLERALAEQADVPASRYAQLATVRADGKPANRTIVFRLFGDRPDRLLFTTDVRSEKVAELARLPWAELCWYFGRTREQFRLAGLASVETNPTDPGLATLRLLTWQERSDASRQSFTWPHPELLASGGEFGRPTPPGPPDVFALLVLDVAAVDYLDLRPEPHTRLKASRADGWVERAVNP